MLAVIVRRKYFGTKHECIGDKVSDCDDDHNIHGVNNIGNLHYPFHTENMFQSVWSNASRYLPYAVVNFYLTRWRI